MDYAFQLNFKVRDYECDLQGVVNNSVYQNYLEHTRHEFLLSRGIQFAELAKHGINLVVVRAELDYKRSLKSGDEFWVGLTLQKISKIRGAFKQDIFHSRDNTLVLSAKIEWTALNANGKPFYYAPLDELYI
ncbi:MAG TPA: acyl-CoA thioesterase [Cellvibrionaceae bacterium]